MDHEYAGGHERAEDSENPEFVVDDAPVEVLPEADESEPATELADAGAADDGTVDEAQPAHYGD